MRRPQNVIRSILVRQRNRSAVLDQLALAGDALQTWCPSRSFDGEAAISVVRHILGCPTLLAQTRMRWPTGG
jgi:hypothetical protein